MKLYTIGFTQKSAERFFTLLRGRDILRLIDIRLNNSSQLAGFAKMDDLRFFLRELCGIGYLHLPELAPSKEILEAFRENGDWNAYERGFLRILNERRIGEIMTRETFDRACLLCSEAEPDRCHRRLVAEYLASIWGDMDICHLV
jgi:uncharacterized protein (DUF488 family)